MAVPRDAQVVIKYRLDASELIAALDSVSKQCQATIGALHQLEAATAPQQCAHNTAPIGEPPEYCGDDTTDDSEFCVAHRYQADRDNSDEPAGFDD